MINRYPLWKNALILVVLLGAVLYALPNLYGENPALQISASRGASVDDGTQRSMEAALKEAGLAVLATELTAEQGLLIRLEDSETQLKAQEVVKRALGDKYTVALNLAPATPDWLRALGGKPMSLGLDLRGGVHFLMEVDMAAALQQAEERYVNDIRTLLRDAKIHYMSVARRAGGGLEVKFRAAENRAQALEKISEEFRSLDLKELDSADAPALVAVIDEAEQREVQRFAVQQNITTLRNRVNELGVAEPLIQQQGVNRIVVQLPGIQDTARAKEILSATATLEFRLADQTGDVQAAVQGRPPANSKLYYERNGSPILLNRRIIVTGDQITDASSGIDQNDGSPAVFIRLDGKGAKVMLDTTKENVGSPMAVVFIENKTETKVVGGQEIKEKRRVEEVINVATIREPFGARFQITGLDSTQEARNLALLLRAGALSAPIDIVEERTVGPSLGRDNIEQGWMSAQLGLALVLVFMIVYYRIFGVVANLALVSNMVLMVAVMSLLQATLTMPGIAGIVLTMGMAVDANVLIFERIREEIRAGNSPQAAIHAGFERAFATIADSNITTLIAALMLFAFGTGPVKGFAVTLSVGILTSMFSAVMVGRAIINFSYGGRRVERLSV